MSILGLLVSLIVTLGKLLDDRPKTVSFSAYEINILRLLEKITNGTRIDIDETG